MLLLNWYALDSLVALMVKCLPAVRETQVHSLGQEDSLEEEMTNYFSVLAWKITLTEEPVMLQSMGWILVIPEQA